MDVLIEPGTVWPSQARTIALFGRDRSVISRHRRYVFAEGELPVESNMQKMHTAGSDKPTTYFSLDAIISVGYRVNSRRGTQFRIWAARTLREHLLRGFTLHERRLRERGLGDIEQAVALLGRTLTANALVTDEGRAVLRMASWR